MSDIKWIISMMQDYTSNNKDPSDMVRVLCNHYYMITRIIQQCIQTTSEPLLSSIMYSLVHHDLFRKCNFPFHKRSAMLSLFNYCFRGDTGNFTLFMHLLSNMVIDDNTKPHHDEMITSHVRNVWMETFIGDALLKRKESFAAIICQFAQSNQWPLRTADIISYMRSYYGSIYINDDEDTKEKRLATFNDQLNSLVGAPDSQLR